MRCAPFRLISMNTQHDIAENLLHTIEQALAILQADSIVFFPYENYSFLPNPIVCGTLLYSESRNLLTLIEKNGLANLTLKLGSEPIYLEDEQDYLEVLQQAGTAEYKIPHTEDCWQREKIKSAIFLRL